MQSLGIVASHPRRAASTALEGTAVEAQLSSLGFIGTNLAVNGLLFLVVISNHLNGLLVSSVGDELVTAGDLLYVDRLAAMRAFAERQERKVVVDIVVLVPVGMDVGPSDGVSSIGSSAIMVSGGETEIFSVAADAVTSSEDDVAVLAFDDARGAEVTVDIASVEGSYRGDAVEGSGTREDNWRGGRKKKSDRCYKHFVL